MKTLVPRSITVPAPTRPAGFGRLPVVLAFGLAMSLAGCSPPEGGEESPEEEGATGMTEASEARPSWNRIASLLADGQVVFGIFSGEKTPETAMEMAKLELADFIFYSLETGPFDLTTMATYQEALSPPDSRGAANPHPIAFAHPAHPRRDGRSRGANGCRARRRGVFDRLSACRER